MHLHRFGTSFVVGLLLLASTGCVGLTAQLLYVIKGDPQIPAEFPGLEGKRVAVVCVADTSNYDPSSASSQLAQGVGLLLQRKIKNIKVVRPDEVNDWMDNSNWKQLDFRDVGKGVHADMVVGIDLEGLRLREGPTLYKGHASVTVHVYDMSKRGEQVYHFNMADFTYPTNSGQHVADTSNREFQNRFIAELSNHVGRHFYPYDIKEDFAPDRIQ